MAILLGLLIIAAISYLGSVYAFSKEKLPAILRYLFFSGFEYILLGIALGPIGLDLFPKTMTASFAPIIHLGLGWVGLFLGLQLRISDINRLQSNHLAITFLQVLFTGMLVALALWFPLKSLLSSQPYLLHVSVAALAASASISSPTIMYLIGKETGYREKILKLLHVITNLDGIIAVAVIGIAFTLLRPVAGYYGSLLLLFQSVGIGVFLGYIFTQLPREKLTENELIVIFLGFLLFSSGVGGILQVSPLFINLVCGMYLANMLTKDDKFHAVIINAEKPLYILMLIIAGIMFSYPGGFGLLLSFLIIVFRFAGKYLFMAYAAPRLDRSMTFPANAGFALASQGAMALTIGFAFLTTYPGNNSEILFSVILICVMVSEMIAPYLITKVFRGIS
ncbi:MAG: hypothetical protein OEY64_02815 [Nitrospinota bacterium]|nr:hypothetical protein [Nitrospinota bacterium]